jgi:hypothetical protein
MPAAPDGQLASNVQPERTLVRPKMGGPRGYADFLGGIADPDHEERSNYLSWSGGNFDPARFDLPTVQRALAKIKN